MKKRKILMTMYHQRAWDELRRLEDGERIKGDDLQKRIGIKEKRRFFAIIEDLRDLGMLVSGSKSAPMGYSEIRTVKELESYLKPRRNEHKSELRKLDKMERKWYQDQAERMKKDA